MQVMLVIEHEASRERRRLTTGRLTIGRAAGNDWVIEDAEPTPTLSRRHCLIEGAEGHFTITDLGSTNGTYLNDRPVPPQNPLPLAHGDRVRVGRHTLLLAFEQPAFAVSARSPAPRPVPEGLAGLDHILGGFGSPEIPQTGDPVDKGVPSITDDPLGGLFRENVPSPPPTPPPPRGVGSTRGDHAPPHFESFQLDGPRPPEPPQPQLQPPVAAAADPASLVTAFLAGAGLSRENITVTEPEAFLREIGTAFAAMAEALRLLLAARALVKEHSGIERTVIRSSDNNPLKYSINAREATRALLERSESGYLPPLKAIEASLQDLQAHEIAILDGMRAALQALLDRFDPKELEARLANEATLNLLLQGGRRAKLWDLFTERYAEIAEAARRRFMGDFDDAFQDAYRRKIREFRGQGGDRFEP